MSRMAWQFDCPEIGEGVVQAFRRDESPYESACFKLRGLQPDATYIVTNLDTDAGHTQSGQDLMTHGCAITMTQRPDSAIVTYKRM